MSKQTSNNHSHWILFILFPFFSALAAINNYRSGWAKNIIWAFIIFYGSTFAISRESNISGSESDIVRYVFIMKSIYGKPLDFDQSVKLFKESGEADILQTIIMILVSRVTDSSQVLTTVYAFIFGYFFSRNLWYIIERLRGKPRNYTVLLLLIFFLINPFWNINGFRFNTAAHIFFMGILPLIYENKKRFLWISFSSILVHFTFIFPIAILLIYLALGKKMHLYFLFFILSIFIQQINIASFNSFVETNLPDLFVERSKNYRDEERVGEFREVAGDEGEGSGVTKVWYAAYFSEALNWSCIALLIAFYFLCRDKIQKNKTLLNAFCFTLLFFALANLLVSIPSGSRFLMIATLLTTTFSIFYLQNETKNKYLENLLLMLTPAFILFVIVALRTGFYSISVNTLIGNPFILLFTDYNISLNDIIK